MNSVVQQYKMLDEVHDDLVTLRNVLNETNCKALKKTIINIEDVIT